MGIKDLDGQDVFNLEHTHNPGIQRLSTALDDLLGQGFTLAFHHGSQENFDLAERKFHPLLLKGQPKSGKNHGNHEKSA